MDAKEHLINHACLYREANKKRVAAPEGDEKEQARKKERIRHREFFQAVDLYQHKRDEK